jgi:hypothetical protein
MKKVGNEIRFNDLLNVDSSVTTTTLCGMTKYRVTDKSLPGPEKKQATATKDFEFHISYL